MNIAFLFVISGDKKLNQFNSDHSKFLKTVADKVFPHWNELCLGLEVSFGKREKIGANFNLQDRAQKCLNEWVKNDRLKGGPTFNHLVYVLEHRLHRWDLVKLLTDKFGKIQAKQQQIVSFVLVVVLILV